MQFKRAINNLWVKILIQYNIETITNYRQNILRCIYKWSKIKLLINISKKYKIYVQKLKDCKYKYSTIINYGFLILSNVLVNIWKFSMYQILKAILTQLCFYRYINKIKLEISQNYLSPKITSIQICYLTKIATIFTKSIRQPKKSMSSEL